MQQQSRRWKPLIFPKLFLAFMILVAPLYIIGLTINMLGQSRVEQELTASLQSNTSFYLDMLELENEHMMNLLQEYMLDKDLQHLTYLNGTMTQFEFTEVIRRVQSKLEQLKGSSVYAASASAHILTLGRTLSSESSISSVLSPEFAAVESLTRTSSSGLFYWNNRMFLAISYPGVEMTLAEPGFILSIQLNETAMKQSLRLFGQNGDKSGAALIRIQDDRTITDYDDGDMLAAVRTVLEQQQEEGVREGIHILNYDNRDMIVSFKYSPIMDFYMTSFIPIEEMLGPVDAFSNLLWALSFCSLIAIVTYSYWVYRQIFTPLQNLIKAFRKVEHGQLAPIDLPRSNDEFLYLYQRFNVMIEKLNVLIHQAYEQKLRVQSSELKQLQSQINPHFLYNTYFILYRLAKMKNHESIAQFVKYLGEYFQYITRNSADDLPLEREFQHSRTYSEIQNIRFQGRIAVEFDPLHEPYKRLLVPRLILQPVFENAYKHGLESVSRHGLIRVKVSEDDRMLYISIEDSGERLTNEQLYGLIHSLRATSGEMEYTGLLNVHRRLQIRFGPESGIEVDRSELGGLKVTLKLLKAEADYHAAANAEEQSRQ